MPDSFSSDTYDQLCDDAEGCLSEGHIEQAREQLIKAVSLIRTRPRARSLLADACMAMELWSEARTQLESLLTIDEDNPKNIFRLGQVLEELGEVELAIDNYEVVLRMEPDNHLSEVAINRLKQDKGNADFDLEQLFASSEPTAPSQVEEEVNFKVVSASDGIEDEEAEPEEETFVVIDDRDKPEEILEELVKGDEDEQEKADVDSILQEIGISSGNSDVLEDIEEEDSISELLDSIGVSCSKMDMENDDHESAGEILIGEVEEETMEKQIPDADKLEEPHVEQKQDEGILSSIDVLFGEPDATDDEKEQSDVSTMTGDIPIADESERIANYRIKPSSDSPYFKSVNLESGTIILSKDILQAYEHKLRVELVKTDSDFISISGIGWLHLRGKSSELVVIEHPDGITVRKSAIALKDPIFIESSTDICSGTEFVKLTAENPLPMIIRMNRNKILEISSPNPSLVAEGESVVAFEKTVNVADADFNGYLVFSGYGKIYLCSGS